MKRFALNIVFATGFIVLSGTGVPTDALGAPPSPSQTPYTTPTPTPTPSATSTPESEPEAIDPCSETPTAERITEETKLLNLLQTFGCFKDNVDSFRQQLCDRFWGNIQNLKLQNLECRSAETNRTPCGYALDHGNQQDVILENYCTPEMLAQHGAQEVPGAPGITLASYCGYVGLLDGFYDEISSDLCAGENPHEGETVFEHPGYQGDCREEINESFTITGVGQCRVIDQVERYGMCYQVLGCLLESDS